MRDWEDSSRMLQERDWYEETQRLASVIGLVQEQLDEIQRIVREQTTRTREQRRSMWEDAPRQVISPEEWIELAQVTTALGQQERSLAFYQAQVRRLEKMLHSPYFGRLDFREAGADAVQRIYVGIATLHDRDTGDLKVFDWRAPICSLFYDAELGPATYECQDGSIAGHVELKRQFKIVAGQLHYMFDTDLKIDDEVLQELLARSADGRMRTIVTTIQREQNQVIRDHDHGLLLVQGPAGSGKTAIALHRAAYLLYKHRDSLSAKDIVIFSPNRVFSDYISAVLPELGEENVRQTTLHDYALDHLGPRLKVESMYDQLEYLFSHSCDEAFATRVAACCYKASPSFLHVLESYVSYLDSGGATEFMGVAYEGQAIMTPAEMKRLFTENYRDMALSRRLEKIRQRILYLLEPWEERRRRELHEQLASGPDRMFESEIKTESRRRTKEEFRPLKEGLAAWASFDSLAAYRRLFADQDLVRKLAPDAELPSQWPRICQQTLIALDEGRIFYEDVAPLLYLKRVAEGSPTFNAVRHVIVDEGQDYTPLQYELLGMIFPYSSLTVLGDLNQSVHPYMHIGSYEDIASALDREDSTYVRLTKSYRSTQQIMAFSRELLAEPDEVDVVRRDGVKPVVASIPDEERLYEAVSNDVRRAREQGYKSIAVLCKTAADSRKFHERLNKELPALLIKADDEHFRKGVVVLPAYLAKGLEFDMVIIPDAGASKYAREELGLFYTACTRALHELHVYYTGEVTPLLQGIDPALFTASGS